MRNMHLALRGSRLLLPIHRARPLPPPCRFVPISVRFAHRKTKGNMFEIGGPFLPLPKTIEEVERIEGPLSEEQINDPGAIELSIYDEDPTSPTGERLVQHIRTPEERRKHNEIHKMLMEAETNPDYDDRALNRHLLDDMMKEPYFADLTDDLKNIKKTMLLTKAQQEQMLAAAAAQEDPTEPELESALQLATHESLQELMEDPDFVHARAELEELQDVLPETGRVDNEDNAEFQAALDKVLDKLGEDPAFQQKVAAWEAEHGEMKEEDYEGNPRFEEPDELTKLLGQRKGGDYEGKPLFEEPEELTKLLGQMKELMGSLGGDDALDKLEAEMEEALNEDPSDEELEEEIRGREMSFAELGKEILQLAKSSPTGAVRNFDEEEDGEPVDAELEAKVDKIMQDPKLMEKLMYIQKVITEQQQQKAELEMPTELAPDPTKLEPHRITSIRQRMQIVRKDAEHLAALRALRVNLVPPFSIAPALRIFNEAIEYAYIGANDDIRRILWRAYSKARQLPTFIQNIPDEAWDMIYYSQAVTWESNQNRENHLRLLLQDLRSVGKDGPPTHPNMLAEMQKPS